MTPFPSFESGSAEKLSIFQHNTDQLLRETRFTRDSDRHSIWPGHSTSLSDPYAQRDSILTDLCSDHNKPGLIYIDEVEHEENQGLLYEENESEFENKAFVNRAWGRRDSSQRSCSLWTRAKAAATIGCICLLGYVLISYTRSERHLRL